jgi:Holliday junction resolvasome RuvABC endonuclease subunit
METIMVPATLPAPAAKATPTIPSILALDLGTSMGWALRLGTETHSGTMSFRSSRYDGGGMRYVRFRSWLDRLAIERALPAAVYFEEVRRHVATDAAHIYGGFLAGLTAWCEELGLPYQGVPVGTIKRFATGKGNADKSEVIAAVRARGFQPADDNEADAIAILLWVLETSGGVA